jgi:hypothetical protein
LGGCPGTTHGREERPHEPVVGRAVEQERLDAEKIGIPFPQRDLHVVKDMLG